MAHTLNWGIMATGRIAGIFAKALSRSRTGRLVAVASRTQAAADRFGREHGITRCHASYAGLLDNPEVEAIYIATPHPMHAEWAIRAAEAGKHILCEKPLTMNHAEAAAVVNAARKADVFLMEAFMYRCHPQTARLIGLIREGAIGQVCLIQATFSFHAGYDPASRVFSKALGGGGILDVGCYCTSMARLIAGVATGGDFADPVEVKACGHLCETGVDAWTAATLLFPGGIVAELATGVMLEQENVVRIFGSEGRIVVPAPWLPAPEGGATRIVLHRKGQTEPTEIEVHTQQNLWAFQADTMAESLSHRQAPPPAMTWDDTLGNMKTLDRWRASIGLVYDSERAHNP